MARAAASSWLAMSTPVYVTIFVAIRTSLAGDTGRFLERTATTQWGVMVWVYFVGYVPALLMLSIPPGPWRSRSARTRPGRD